MRKPLSLLFAVALVATAVLASFSGVLGQSTPPTTQPPDLVSIRNFRPGAPTDNGTPRTIVDFTFDQPVYLTGGDRTNFHLVRTNNTVVDPQTSGAPAGDRNGDNIVSVLFNGQLSPANFARGYVDNATVSSDLQGNARTNEPQSQEISPSGSSGPDLVSVAYDGSMLVFTFDQDLTAEDVIQDTSGLRFTVASGKVYTSATVTRRDPRTLSATYDLPQGTTVGDAKSGFVTQGTVQSTNGQPNSFDEVATTGCASSPTVTPTGTLTVTPTVTPTGTLTATVPATATVPPTTGTAPATVAPTSTPINRSIRGGGGGTVPTVAPTTAPTEDAGAPRNIRDEDVTPVPREIR